MFADRAKSISAPVKAANWPCKFPQRIICSEWRYSDGGDGVRGGDVIFEVDEGQNTLGDYRQEENIKKKDGQEGGKNAAMGADAKMLY